MCCASPGWDERIARRAGLRARRRATSTAARPAGCRPDAAVCSSTVDRRRCGMAAIEPRPLEIPAWPTPSPLRLPAPFTAWAQNCCGEHDDDDRDDGGQCRHPRLPGRGARAAAPDDPFALQPSRDLPARADLERLGCQRQAALRGAGATGAAGRRVGSQDLDRPRRQGRYADRPRQRHWHDTRGSGRPSGHHREVRHGRVLQAAHRRPAEGLAADRAVRRRLLFRVHRGRRGRGVLAQGGRGGGGRHALDFEGGRRVHGRDGRAGRARHGSGAAP